MDIDIPTNVDSCDLKCGAKKVKLTNLQKVFFPELGKTKRDLAFAHVREVALLVKASVDERKVQSYAKTSGSRGMHIYVPIRRAPLQKEVWRVAKRIAFELAKQRPEIITAEYRVAERPAGRVLVDYNQNACGRTLASVYSVRRGPEASFLRLSRGRNWNGVSRPLICG